MDALVRKRSLERKSVRLDEEGTKLRKEIETSLLKIPNHLRLDLGRRNFNRACVIDTLNLVQRLYAWEDARDDQSPAVNHVLRVGHTIAVEFEIKDPTLIMAAVLHDAVEDHPETLARVWGKRTGKDDHGEAVRLVRRHYGHAVGSLVDRVSKRKNEASASRETKLAAYLSYAQKIARDPAALIVKIADVCDNVMYPRPLAADGYNSMKKYAKVLPILAAGLERHKQRIISHCGPVAYEKISTRLRQTETLAHGFLLNASLEG